VHTLFEHIKDSVAKLKLWEDNLQKKKNCSSLHEYATKLAVLRSEFEERFSDFLNLQSPLD
jgi:hypothetical protein